MDVIQCNRGWKPRLLCNRRWRPRLSKKSSSILVMTELLCGNFFAKRFCLAFVACFAVFDDV